MQINLRRLYGGMTQVFLHHAEILRSPVQFARITVTDLVRRDTRRGIVSEDMLDCPRRNMLALLADKKGACDLVTNKSPDLGKGFIVNEYDPDLVSFPAYTDGMLLKIDVFDIHVTEFRYTDTRRIDRPDNQFVPWILNRIDQTEDLAVLEVFYFLLLDSRALNTA